MGTNSNDGSSNGGNGGNSSPDNSRVMNMILGRLDKIEEKFDDGQERVEAKLDAVTAAIRSQIDAGDEKRLAIAVFDEYRRGTEERLTRLEQSPMKVLAWLGFACGLIGGPLLTIILYILTHALAAKP